MNYIMGLSFITEGAIPFAAADPLRVLPACILDLRPPASVDALWLREPRSHGGAWVIAVITNPVQYLLALAIGAVVGCLVLSFLRSLSTRLPSSGSGRVLPEGGNVHQGRCRLCCLGICLDL
ncbi:MAG: hypothetical protein ACLRM9_05380 [Collinsella aerofaciens]